MSIKAASHAPPPAYVQNVDSDSSEAEKGFSASPDRAAAPRGVWRHFAMVFVTLALVGTAMRFMGCGM